MESIDWEAQWKAHGVGYREGHVHVDVGDYFPHAKGAQPIRMAAGPGFGDLSHPTTRLVLRLMGPYVVGQHVVDIGCGSGILSLAALAMGATSVCAVDIDEAAVHHAFNNALLNGMDKKMACCLPAVCGGHFRQTSLIVLMNMIQMEQAEAWRGVEAFHPQMRWVITSGILAEGEEAYLRQCAQWGWHLVTRQEEGGWVGFVFRTNK